MPLKADILDKFVKATLYASPVMEVTCHHHVVAPNTVPEEPAQIIDEVIFL